MNKQMIIVCLISLIIGAFGGYIYEKARLTPQLVGMQSLKQQLLDEKMTNQELIEDAKENPETEMQETPNPTSILNK